MIKLQLNKKITLYILFVMVASLFLAEMALRIPAVESLVAHSRFFRAELSSNNGYDFPEADEKKIKEMIGSGKSQLFEGPVTNPSTKNEPVSPIGYTKGKGKDLGSTPIRSIKIDESSGKTVYDVSYGFDSHRRRLTSNLVDEKKANGTIAIIGCSFVFGMGVSDSETIPSYVQSEVGDKYRVLNLGIIGAGANDFLDDLNSAFRINDIDQKKGGVAVYVYFSRHRERTFCLTDCYREEWQRNLYLNKSAWEVSNDFEVNRTGTVEQSRSAVVNFLRTLFYNTQIGLFSTSFYSAELPFYKREYTKYIKALSKQWEKKNFRFVVYLLDTPETSWTDEDLNILKENSVDYIYFKRSSLFNELANNGVISGDSHFNSAGNRFRALQIIEGLKLKGYISKYE